MRAISILVATIILIGVVWVAGTPVRARVHVDAFADPAADHAAAEAQLRQLGGGALPALHDGMLSTSPQVALRCARLLGTRGDKAAEKFLLRVLREHGTEAADPVGAQAEAYLQAVWDQRDGPDDGSRAKLTHFINEHRADYHQIALLNEILEHYPNWCQGYVRRARIYQRNGDAQEARRDALKALEFAPQQFDAIVILAQVFAQIDAPQQAHLCMTKAVEINPRLKETLKEDFKELQKDVNDDNDRIRREKRRERPAI